MIIKLETDPKHKDAYKKELEEFKRAIIQYCNGMEFNDWDCYVCQDCPKNESELELCRKDCKEEYTQSCIEKYMQEMKKNGQIYFNIY